MADSKSLNMVPLFFIKDEMTIDSIKLYHKLAMGIIFTSELTMQKAQVLFNAIYRLNIFIKYDIEPIEKYGSPVGETLTKFQDIKRELTWEFKKLGLTEEDFDRSETSIPFPENIQIKTIKRVK